jgi:hypothetical protein
MPAFYFIAFALMCYALYQYFPKTINSEPVAQFLSEPTNSELVTQFLSENPVTKVFLNNGENLSKLNSLVYIESTKGYGCVYCQIENMSSDNAVIHFQSHDISQEKFSRSGKIITLGGQIEALQLLKDGHHIGELNPRAYKNDKYPNAYISQNFPGLLPNFLKAIQSHQSKPTTKPRDAVTFFYDQLKAGKILTKLHPLAYRSQETSHPGMPIASYIILQQLYNPATYRPSPRDIEGNNANGKNISTKWRFNPTINEWKKGTVEKKSGPKRTDKGSKYMQKTSVTLASPFGFKGFAQDVYITGFAFNADMCLIDENYTWFNNAVTYSKWWYGSQAPYNSNNPATFTGIQLANLFSKVRGNTAKQNEILARPNLDAVAAIVGVKQSITSRLTAYSQAQWINTYYIFNRNIHKTIPVMLKTDGSEIYVEYDDNQLIEDLISVLWTDCNSFILSNDNKDAFAISELMENGKPNIKTISGLKKNLLTVPFSREVIVEAIDKVNISDKIPLFHKKTIIEQIQSLKSDYYKDYTIVEFLTEDNSNGILSEKIGQQIDAMKKLLQTPTISPGSQLLREKIRDALKKSYKGWNVEDIKNAINHFSINDQVVSDMISFITPNRCLDLCKQADESLKSIIIEARKENLDTKSRLALYRLGNKTGSIKYTKGNDIEELKSKLTFFEKFSFPN